MTTLSSVPSFPEERRLKGQENFNQFKDFVISSVRSRGLMGYLDGAIQKPTSSVSNILSTASPAYSLTPTLEEWIFREGHVSGLIYQNIVDPDSHGIKPDQAAVDMWISLKDKFEVSTQIHKDIAMKKLESVRLADGGDLNEHLKTLSKLRVAANAVGCKVDDPKMISVILGSLPTSWIFLVQIHQSKTVLAEVTAALTEYWTYLNRDQIYSTQPDPTALVATNINPPLICDNCGVKGHSKARCWALGGGQEGKGPKWWRAPKGKEPRAALVTTPLQSFTPTTATVNSYDPMETYALGEFSTDDLNCMGKVMDW